jgi:hypothetical protein
MTPNQSAMVEQVNQAMAAAHGQPEAEPLPDLADEPGAAQGYEEWISQRMIDEELADLIQWARQTLLCAPLPCVCLNRTCLRCRVDAIVNSPAGERCPKCGAPQLWAEGEVYCPNCTRFVTTEGR